MQPELTDRELKEFVDKHLKRAAVYRRAIQKLGEAGQLGESFGKAVQQLCTKAGKTIGQLLRSDEGQLQLREALIRADAVKHLKNDMLREWIQGHQPGWQDNSLSDETLSAWGRIIRAGSKDPAFLSVLASLNATGFFPGELIDKKAPESVLQRMALAALGKIAGSPKFRETAERNLRRGIGAG